MYIMQWRLVLSSNGNSQECRSLFVCALVWGEGCVVRLYVCRGVQINYSDVNEMSCGPGI